MNRRMILTAAAAFAALTFAGGALAGNETKTVPADKVFPFITNYYALAPADRAHFHLVYSLIGQGAKLSDISLSLNGAPINIGPNGVLSPLPTDSQLKAKATVTYSRPAGSKFGISLGIFPNAQPQQTMDVRPLNQAIDEARKGAKSMAGLLALAVPTLDRLMIYGVTSGQVKLADGQVKPLPFTAETTDKNGGKHPAHLTYVPAGFPTAQNLIFNATPTLLSVESKD